MHALKDMPISFPGLFGDWEFNPNVVAIDIGNGIYWYGIILACAMLLRYSLGLDKEADCVEAACRNVIAAGWRTQDMAEPGKPAIGCQGLGELICQQIELAGEIIG